MKKLVENQVGKVGENCKKLLKTVPALVVRSNELDSRSNETSNERPAWAR